MRIDGALAIHLAPDSINRLRQAGEQRFASAEILVSQGRRLAAVYFYGFSTEMTLAAAVFRSQGFSPNEKITREARRRRMAEARLNGLMTNDAHHIVGWARVLEQQKTLQDPAPGTAARLREAVNRATQIYKYWRPELRYKTTHFDEAQVMIVRRAAAWFIENRDRL
jgi:hypothetical protein